MALCGLASFGLVFFTGIDMCSLMWPCVVLQGLFIALYGLLWQNIVLTGQNFFLNKLNRPAMVYKELVEVFSFLKVVKHEKNEHNQFFNLITEIFNNLPGIYYQAGNCVT